MAKNRNNSPVDDLNQPLGGDSPDYEPTPQDRDYSPADAQRTEALERDFEVAEANDSPVGEPATNFGTSATITKLGEPDYWLLESGDVSKTFQGDVHSYLTLSGVTSIEDITDYPESST